MDETGARPSRDANGFSKHRCYSRRNNVTDAKLAGFSYTSRVTAMPCVSGEEDCAPSLFVSKGPQLTYRHVLNHGNHKIETLSDCLPRG